MIGEYRDRVSGLRGKWFASVDAFCAAPLGTPEATRLDALCYGAEREYLTAKWILERLTTQKSTDSFTFADMTLTPGMVASVDLFDTRVWMAKQHRQSQAAIRRIMRSGHIKSTTDVVTLTSGQILTESRAVNQWGVNE